MAYKHILFDHLILPFIYSFIFVLFQYLCSLSLSLAPSLNFNSLHFISFVLVIFNFFLFRPCRCLLPLFPPPLCSSPSLLRSVLLSSLLFQFGSSQFRKLVMCVVALDLKPFSHLCRLRSFSIQLDWHFSFIYIYYIILVCFFFFCFLCFKVRFQRCSPPRKLTPHNQTWKLD